MRWKHSTPRTWPASRLHLPEAGAQAVDLLRGLIRNRCVNDGSADSGEEIRNADLLASFLELPGVDLETYEPHPGRRSLLARLEGRGGPDAPSLLLMGHTDVVPVEESGWQRDPFGAEIVDGWIWGRGAVDMLNLTASMAAAFRQLATRKRPALHGTLSFLAVADEEAQGTFGAGWLTENRPEIGQVDGVLTEAGGIPIESANGIRLPVLVAEKGSHWCTLRVKGTPGHGSRPYRSDNALVTAAEVVRRLSLMSPPARIHPVWSAFVDALGLPEELARQLTDPDLIDAALDNLPDPLAREAHAATRTTFAPTVCRCGQKANVIPGSADIEVDIRTLPGQSANEVRAMIQEALGDIAHLVEVSPIDDEPASESSTRTRLWEALSTISGRLCQGASLVPMLSVGATDARFFRRMGIPAYGFGLFSRKMTLAQFSSMFHGNDERVDIESVELSTLMWATLAEEYLA
jgi:acetylornithine deacetylase/succinyl-diaminopimelate desuccinylase-like protein